MSNLAIALKSQAFKLAEDGQPKKGLSLIESYQPKSVVESRILGHAQAEILMFTGKIKEALALLLQTQKDFGDHVALVFGTLSAIPSLRNIRYNLGVHMKKILGFVTLLSILSTVSIIAHAQIVDKKGRMYLETGKSTNLVEMHEGMTITLIENQSLPGSPDGFTWIRTGVPSGGFGDIYELVALSDPRYSNNNYFNLLMMIDDLRTPYEMYTTAERKKMIAEGLREEGYTGADATKLAGKLVDSKNKKIESEEIIRKFKASENKLTSCQKLFEARK